MSVDNSTEALARAGLDYGLDLARRGLSDGHDFVTAGFGASFGGTGSFGSSFSSGSQMVAVAAATVGGTGSNVTDNKFANGAVESGYFLAAAEVHPFIKKSVEMLRERKFWEAFVELETEQFRVLFPSLSTGDDDFVEWAKLATYETEYRSNLPQRALSAARDANSLLREYYWARVSGIVGARKRIVRILGNAGALTKSQERLLQDALAVKAFADTQNMNIDQLSELADILIEANQTIDDRIKDLQEN